MIDNASTEPTIPQLLLLLNGWVDQHLFKKNSQLVHTVGKGRNNNEKVQLVFLSILGRMPTDAEAALGRRTISTGVDEGLADLAWALLNSHEFLFVQ